MIKNLLLALVLVSGVSIARTGEKSFKPTGAKVPIMKIGLSRTQGTEVILYKCSGSTPAECLVDLADDDSLATIVGAAAKVEIEESTYTRLAISD